MLQIYDDSESPNERACLGYTCVTIAKCGVLFKMYGEPESSNEGAFLSYIYDEPNRQMRGPGLRYIC